MAQTVSVIVGPEDRARLAAILGDRNSPLKQTQRVNIILLSAERLSVMEVARRAGVSRPAVWRWQVRYAEQGVDGLLRDKTRKPGKAPLPAATVAKILALTCSEPPGAVTHWTGRAMAAAVGISLRAVPCSASGRPTAFSRIVSAPSSAPTTRRSRPRSRTSSACT